MKQNLASLVILPPKNGGLRAWSHSVRKANLHCALNYHPTRTKEAFYYSTRKSISKLVKLPSYVEKCSKIEKIDPREVCL